MSTSGRVQSHADPFSQVERVSVVQIERHETPRRGKFLGAILGGLAVANRSWVLNRGGRGALLALMTFAPNIPTSEMTFGPDLTHRQATKLLRVGRTRSRPFLKTRVK